MKRSLTCINKKPQEKAGHVQRLIVRGSIILAILGMIGGLSSNRTQASPIGNIITGFLTCDLCGTNLFDSDSSLPFLEGSGDTAVASKAPNTVEFEANLLGFPLAMANFIDDQLFLDLTINSESIDFILSLVPPDLIPTGPIPLQVTWGFSVIDCGIGMTREITGVELLPGGDFNRDEGGVEHTESDIFISHSLLIDNAASFHQGFQILVEHARPRPRARTQHLAPHGHSPPKGCYSLGTVKRSRHSPKSTGEEIMRWLTPLSALRQDILRRLGLRTSLYQQLKIQETGN